MSALPGFLAERTGRIEGGQEMVVKLYRLESTVTAGGDIFDLLNPKGRIPSFFIRNEGTDKPFRFSKPKAEAQPMIQLQHVLESDYLRANIGVPLFSEKVRAALSATLPGEIQFYECLVRCQGREITFFLGKALMYLPLVNKRQSEFRTLSGGERILTRAVWRRAINEVVVEFPAIRAEG